MGKIRKKTLNSKEYPTLVRIYLRFYKITAATFRYLHLTLFFFLAIIEGFWLGVLNKKTLYAITRHCYDTSKQYQSAEWNKKGLFLWEEKVFRDYFKECKTLMLLGAGGGREVFSLAKLGYRVDGYECSIKLVNYANTILEKGGHSSKVQYAPEDTIPLIEKRYDGVVLGWGAYSHIKGKRKRIEILKTASGIMNKHGPILVSFWAMRTHSGIAKCKACFANIFTRIRGAEKIEVGDELNYLYGRFFTRDDIESELSEAGFEILYYDDSQYGCVVGKKSTPV